MAFGKSQRSRRFLACLCALGAMACTPLAAQTDTTFTYQGTLNDAGSPANGDYAMRFLLYDGSAGGKQIGATVTIAAQTVTDGFFAAELDYGADAFDNTERWLAIVVNGTTLSPRQPITRSPYSIQTRGINVTESGFVGIGRTDKATASEIFGIHRPGSLFGGMFASTDENGRPFYGYDNDIESAYHFLDGETGDWKLFVDDIRMTVTDEGNVGIGTESPLATLHVASAASSTIYGHGTAITGSSYGVHGVSDSVNGTGVRGVHNSTSGEAPGVLGETNSTSLVAYGVHGRVNSLSSGVVSAGVRGENLGTVNIGMGVFGSHEGGGMGVFGRSHSGNGVTGRSFGPDGKGVYGHHFALSGTAGGVLGDTNSVSNNAVGVHGLVSSTSPGTFSAAVRGENMGAGTAGIGVWGSQSGSGWGIYGQSLASSGSGIGVRGEAFSTNGFDFFAAGAGTNYGASSSIRWKSNIHNIDQPLEKIARLRGVYYDWDDEHGGGHDVGMIAEEVGAVMPEIVQYEENGIDAIGMDYSKMTPLLVEAVNALQAKQDSDITTLRRAHAAELNDLREQLSDLQQMVERLASNQEKESR